MELGLTKRRHIAIAMCLLLLFIGGCSGMSPNISPNLDMPPSPIHPITTSPKPTVEPSLSPPEDIASSFILEYEPEHVKFTISASLCNEFIGTGVTQIELSSEDGTILTFHVFSFKDMESPEWTVDYHSIYPIDYIFTAVKESGEYVITATLGYYDDNGDIQTAYRSNPLYMALTVNPNPVRVDSTIDGGVPSWREDAHLFNFTGDFERDEKEYIYYTVIPYDKNQERIEGGNSHGAIKAGVVDAIILLFDTAYVTIQEVRDFSFEGDQASVTVTLPQAPMIELVWNPALRN